MAQTNGTVIKLNGVLKFCLQVLQTSWGSEPQSASLREAMLYSSPPVTNKPTPLFLRICPIIWINQRGQAKWPEQIFRCILCQFVPAFSVRFLQTQARLLRGVKISVARSPDGLWYLFVLIGRITSCQFCGAYNFEVVSRLIL